MEQLDLDATHRLLNRVIEYELAGVVRYTHYALMVRGAYRLPIVDFFKAQATESLLHAQQAGEILTGLEGHPSVAIAPIQETNQHSISALLTESLQHEQEALSLYKQLLEAVQGRSVYLEEYTRGLIGQEELHLMEIKKMVRDYKH